MYIMGDENGQKYVSIYMEDKCVDESAKNLYNVLWMMQVLKNSIIWMTKVLKNMYNMEDVDAQKNYIMVDQSAQKK